MRSAIIKKSRLDEIQNQKATTNINYIQNFMSIEKLNNKVKIASDKIETKEKNLHLFKNIWDQSIIKLGNN